MCFQMIFCVMCMCCLYFSFEYQPEPRIKLIDLLNWAAALHGCIGIKTMTAVAVNNRKHTWWECGGRGPFWWPWSHDMGEAETWREGGRMGRQRGWGGSLVAGPCWGQGGPCSSTPPTLQHLNLSLMESVLICLDRRTDKAAVLPWYLNCLLTLQSYKWNVTLTLTPRH